MSDGQAYYDGLIVQGYTPEQATQYTQQHYAGFEPAVAQVAPVADFQVEQTHVTEVAQEYGVDSTQLVDTARHFDANADGILQQRELQATAMQMTSTVAPTAPAPMAAAPMAAAPMAAAPMAAPPGMAAAPMAAPPGMAAAPMAAPMMAGAPMGGMGMMPAPAAASGGGGPLGYVAVACIVLTLVFSTWGVLGGEWLVPDADDEDMEGMEMYATLKAMHISMDVSILTAGLIDCDEMLKSPDIDEDATCDGDILTQSTVWSDICDDTDDEDACDAASAGLYGSIILWIAVAAGLGAAVLIIFNVFGIGALPVDTQKFGFIAGVAAGALAGIAVLVWYLMLPDSGGMNSGLNVWLTITGAATGIAAGILTKLKGNPSA